MSSTPPPSGGLHAPRAWSRLGAALVVAVVGALFAVQPAAAQQPPPEPISTADFCSNAPDDSAFEDIQGTTFEDVIICLELLGITRGSSLSEFNPDVALTRAQMASFVARMLDEANEQQLGEVSELPTDAPDAFEDVEDGDTHAAAINRLAAVDIVRGGPGAMPAEQFGPGLPIARDQMASLINRAIGFLTGTPLTTDQEFFSDVTSQNVHGDNVNAIASVGITQGVTADRYAPDRAVMRGQMAAFIVRTMSVLSERGAISPPAPPAMASFATVLSELNGTGASGTASVEVQGTVATVTLEIDGTSPNLPHAQHIHIGGRHECPTMADEDPADSDTFISTPEGVPAYGTIAVSLTTSGDVGPASGLAVDRMPVGSGSGVVTYERTFRLPAGVDAADLQDGVVVHHGFSESSLGSDPSAYDGPDSPLAEGVPQEATLPAACGALAPAGATTYDAVLTQLNETGATGSATVVVNGNLVTVQLQVTGTSPSLPHAQHIHIGGRNECPTAADEDPEDSDMLISTPEGAPAYGTIQVSLTTEGDVSPASGLAVGRMPVASGAGVVTYERTFTLPADVQPAEVADGVIVHHGFAESSLGTDPTTYDGPDSPLAEGVPQEATLPAACGALAVS